MVRVRLWVRLDSQLSCGHEFYAKSAARTGAPRIKVFFLLFSKLIFYVFWKLLVLTVLLYRVPVKIDFYRRFLINCM